MAAVGDLFRHKDCGGLLLVNMIAVRCKKCSAEWLRWKVNEYPQWRR
jgi:hypothetical protein